MQFTVRAPHRIKKAKAGRTNWKKIGCIVGVGSIVLLIIIQLLYPWNNFALNTHIDGINVGGKSRTDAARILNEEYARRKVAIYMGDSKSPVVSPYFSDIGIQINNPVRIKDAGYPWYLRIIPTSLFWAGAGKVTAPIPSFGNKFADYVDAKIMPDCRQPAIDATLKANGNKLELVRSTTGGTCERTDIISGIKKVKPSLSGANGIRVAREEQAPIVGDDIAIRLADVLNNRLTGGITIDVLGSPVVASPNDVMSWLDFTVKDNSLIVVVNNERTGEWLSKNIASKVAITPGVSYIKTIDFTELSRVNGAPGRALDIQAVVASMQQVVDGRAENAIATTVPVAPSEQYTRTYSASDKGLTALLSNYAKDNPGTFGISLIELDGKKRRASYDGDRQFVTASTYKLFVAYSLLKQIDVGKRDWAGSEACFNTMISNSDNACAEGFLQSVGLQTVTKDIQAIGLKNSTFMKTGGPFTTANDLALLLWMIATGQNFSSANQQRLIAAMKGNIYRKGIPAGASGTVADKVGFLNGLFHDAAIVYSPNGTYVLAIMTEGSNWTTIADLTKQIDALHAR